MGKTHDENYKKKNDANHSVSISGNANGVQIQQNVSNSAQSQIVSEHFDYEEASKILLEISQYELMFEDTYGSEAKQVLEALNQAKQAVTNREQPSKINGFLNVVKDISLGVSSSLIATGILGLLSQIGV